MVETGVDTEIEWTWEPQTEKAYQALVGFVATDSVIIIQGSLNIE
jgi:hypothetical protein